MNIFPEKIRRLWNLWELRYLVLIILFIQTLLISFASVRKHTATSKINFLVWSCYLLAYWVAILVLGVLAESMNNKSNGGGKSGNEKYDLKSFWEPFLLLHLGGPDIHNITAFSLEDNELWLRHLLGFLFPVGTAFYIFIISLPEHGLWLITILMFMAGIIKYVERTLALMNASRDYFRNSMVTEPDPGPNYAKFMEEYSCKKNAGLEARIIFKRLIVDLILTFHDPDQSRNFFTNTSSNDAYEVIEIEIGFLYEGCVFTVLYTKAAVIHTLKGWIFCFTSVSSIIFFAFTEKQQYDKIDIKITYVLLNGAIALEVWSLTRLLFTDWTLVWMKKKFNPFITTFVFKVVYCRRLYLNRSKWSSSMAQYNLIEFCLEDQPFFWGKVMELIHVKDFFDNHRYTSTKTISDELKQFIFKDLKRKLPKTTDSACYQHFRTCRGQLALQMIKYDETMDDYNRIKEILDNSIKVGFDESILLRHIATDICYYLDGEECQPETVQINQRNSRDISNYMLYLLVSRPFMSTAGIRQIRFGDTCAEAKRFLHGRGTETDKKRACTRLHEVDTKIPLVQVKGDRSKSVIFEASRVAKLLLKQVPQVEKRLEIISLVWLEMLCYVASECKGYYHAQRLSAG
ncbi:uncharacterized protein LOC122089552 [Macadamia integrifolia]|uniref:uncharacterized protein LOC122089552 n=1 Tax=Macadamia integrifolia TaxID=60698 RepID=UPI001C4E532E|nr:uncharacterized protein LOC122089552 [Macadamia integrifolia]